MMEYSKIADLWRETYSSNLKSYEEFEVTDYFRKMSALFSPGQSYFFVINMHNIKLDYVSPEVNEFYKTPLSEINIETLLQNTPAEDLSVLEKKEEVIQDFFINFLPQSKRQDYKVLYTYELHDDYGNKRTMLLQATVISLSNDGYPQHILSIHTDISHFSPKASNHVSFLDLMGNESYFNVKTEKGIFRPDLALGPDNTPGYTGREKEIIKLLSQGHETAEIAEILHISPNTVSTHRKNILKKGEYKNTAHLVGNIYRIGI